MIVVDSSVWIDYLRDRATAQVARLDSGFNRDTVSIPDLAVTEVLQGCDTDAEFERVRLRLRAFTVLAVMSQETAVAAARNYRFLRGKGFTVRKTIDCLIATRCILDGLPLLYSDRDFDPFVAHLGLIPAIDAIGAS